VQYLEHTTLREALAQQLRAEVAAKHTYRIRALEFVGLVNSLVSLGASDRGGALSFMCDEGGDFIQKHSEECVDLVSASKAFQKHLLLTTSPSATRTPSGRQQQQQQQQQQQEEGAGRGDGGQLLPQSDDGQAKTVPAICIGVRTHQGRLCFE
jgi:hypothetical protein